MCTYCGTNNYYKIYQNHIGPIPKEDNGRTYEIHHLDGNHNNNNPSNLTAVTLQEHYNIHYEQGDYAACQLMSIQRLNKTPKEISELATLANLQRVKEGRHHFVGGEVQSRVNKQRIDSGTHNWQGSAHNKNRVKNGTHPWQKRADGSSFSANSVANGTCPLSKRVDGTSSATDQLKNGTHASQQKWYCPNCNKHGRHSSTFKRWHSKNSLVSCWNKQIN